MKTFISSLSTFEWHIRIDISEGGNRSGFATDDAAESSLALDDGIGDVELAAQGWQEDHDLQGLHVVRDQHQLGLNQFNAFFLRSSWKI